MHGMISEAEIHFSKINSMPDFEMLITEKHLATVVDTVSPKSN